MSKKKEFNTVEITNLIFIVRDKKVILDRDLSKLYEVQLKALNQAVKRNKSRFPDDFMFQLSSDELHDLWSQFVTMGYTSDLNYMKRNLPYVFTEAGAFALSFVLSSNKSIDMGIFIIRAFNHLRRFVLKNENLMFELQNNHHLSKTFYNFEKRIEQDLLILYKNTNLYDKKIKKIEKRLFYLEDKF